MATRQTRGYRVGACLSPNRSTDVGHKVKPLYPTEMHPNNLTDVSTDVSLYTPLIRITVRKFFT